MNVKFRNNFLNYDCYIELIFFLSIYEKARKIRDFSLVMLFELANNHDQINQLQLYE